MKRFIETELLRWKDDPKRKPLILSGARQVGKSYVIERNLSQYFDKIISINFEKQSEFKNCFTSSLEVLKITRAIEALSGQKIIPEKTLLFFDEIQTCPEAISSLRYFYEDLPSLHLISAGSLLELHIDKASVPIGRVTYRYLSPLSFEEFLYNSGNEILLNEIKNHIITKPFPDALHNKALTLLKEYMAIGGMPQIVETFVETHDYLKCQELLSDIIESYTNDFPKYSKRNADLKYLDLVFSRIPHLVASQFKYVQISRDIQSKYLKTGIDLLTKAGILNAVYKTSGVPLGANYNPDRYKLLFLDMGLMQRACDLAISRWITSDFQLINSGPLAEQFVGQEILANSNFKHARLYYWERNKKNSSAEVDYLLESSEGIIPVEVKSGSIGKLKSLKIFLSENKDIKKGIKTSSDNFGKSENIQSIPLYAFGSWLSAKTTI